MSMLGLLSELPVVTQPPNHDTESASSCRESLYGVTGLSYTSVTVVAGFVH